LQRLIGASKLGTDYNNCFKADSVWWKVRKQYPQALQAAPKLTVEDGREQWMTHYNMNQWFDDVKADLLSSGMVVDEIKLDKNDRLMSEVRLFAFLLVMLTTHNTHEQCLVYFS
jgi:hypothetical protein